MRIETLKIHKYELLVSIVYTLELLFINRLSDLPIEVTNWIEKSHQILSLQIPSDNFYGPGAAILVLPFLWASNHMIVCIAFYTFIGAFCYSKLVSLLKDWRIRLLAYLGLLSNVYLLWLINSSQDTVFEFALLMLASFFYVKKKYGLVSIGLFILSLTRSAYWLLFLTIGGIEVLRYLKTKKLEVIKLLAFPLLLCIALLNYFAYASPSPALEGGMTAYFSYSKYHYLSLPKMDMDVFLSGENGIFSKEFGVAPDEELTGAEENRKYIDAALSSIHENPKETILGWMQKFDSYVFAAQKVPNLPGSYVLDLKENSIQIGDERLNWVLIIGNLIFMLWRSVLFLAGMIAVGLWIAIRHNPISLKLKFLLLPWLIGIFPGVMFYTETRFKVVSEILLIPLILEIYSRFSDSRRLETTPIENLK
jgi:hypothetical protein